MHPRYIFYGFANLKDELRTKLKIKTERQAMLLWFSLGKEELYLHDYDNHQVCLLLALRVQRSGILKIYSEEGSYGYSLVEVVVQSVPFEKVADELNNRFKLYGHWGNRRL